MVESSFTKINREEKLLVALLDIILIKLQDYFRLFMKYALILYYYYELFSCGSTRTQDHRQFPGSLNYMLASSLEISIALWAVDLDIRAASAIRA